MKRLLALIITILPLFAQTISSADFSDAKVSARYFNKTLYYPELVTENPIWIHITISNNGKETLRFKLADDRSFSLDFSVFTVQNRQLQKTNEIVKKRTTNQTVYFREIAIEPGEEYSFVENLKDYVLIKEPSLYYFEVLFYPELYKSKIEHIDSNRIGLDIRPSPGILASSAIPVTADTVSILVPEELSPDKVVEQTIIARQKSLWDQFFLYFDLEQMYTRDPVRDRTYRSESSAARDRILEKFKIDLSQERIDKSIVSLPEKFEIEKTMYTNSKGTVTVLEWFNYGNFTEKKRYTYYVRLRDNIWQIYDYTVDNLGTE